MVLGKMQSFVDQLRARGIRADYLSVATSEKGSYKECDVLNYLAKHLPEMAEGRRWRILLLDA